MFIVNPNHSIKSGHKICWCQVSPVAVCHLNTSTVIRTQNEMLSDACSSGGRHRGRSFTAREVNSDNRRGGSHRAFLHVLFYSWIQQAMSYRECNSKRVEQPQAKGEGQWIIEKVLPGRVQLFSSAGINPWLTSCDVWCDTWGPFWDANCDVCVNYLCGD